jgi:plasmid stability protein
VEAKWRNFGGKYMAILNIKNMPDELYNELKERARRERRSITQEAIHLLEQALVPWPKRSIKELRGLGKEVWADITVEDYIRKEREGWR